MNLQVEDWVKLNVPFKSLSISSIVGVGISVADEREVAE